jgi:hypothetical protein
MKALGWSKARPRDDEAGRGSDGKKKRAYVYQRPEPNPKPNTPPQPEPPVCETCGGRIDGYGVCVECQAGAPPETLP